jgi:mannose-1-phosphate guanylyltransferase
MPKQFVKLFEDRSLFQLTLQRNRDLCEQTVIVSNTDQYFLAVDQAEEIISDLPQSISFLLEPIGRNTAPAIALACLGVAEDEIVLVTPSDHLIKDQEAYAQAVEQAKDLARNDMLVTFGIKPDSPEFCFKAGLFLAELKAYAPEIYRASLNAYESKQSISDNQIRIRHEAMQAIPSESIDYAVMEESKCVAVVPVDMGWSDLGSFESLSCEVSSPADLIEIDAKENLVLSTKQVALIDIDDLIVVDTPDALLISKKGSSQKVKEVVKQLNEKKSELTKVHNLVHRPWGTYEVLYAHDNYKIKRIVVNPGKRLSLQKHLHRNEHWIVVKGEATVQVGESIKTVSENESTYIKQEELHRLSNESDKPIVLIEAQVGSYTGEDDIIRIEDDFRRVDDE